jgi:hypothetical protein
MVTAQALTSGMSVNTAAFRLIIFWLPLPKYCCFADMMKARRYSIVPAFGLKTSSGALLEGD